MRTCSKCKILKEDFCFRIVKSLNNKLFSWCKECERKNKKIRYEIRVEMSKVKCIDCNKKTKGHGQRCSSCATKLKHKQGLMNSHHALIDGRSLKLYYCKDCGKQISWQSGFYGNSRCRRCAVIELFKNPENHPRYVDGYGYEPYPQEFTKKFCDKIRKRDNFICQCCGMGQDEHLEKYNQILHIHHIDYNKHNLNLNNLITLCKQCNMRANTNRDYWYAYYTYIMENKLETIKT